MNEIEVRAVRSGEWENVRELRLRALADDAAAIAFLDTLEGASARPDEFWIDRTANASSDAGPDARAHQVVAITPPGRWVGSVSVILQEAGEVDYHGTEVGEAGGAIVGVYVDPGYRGRGLIERLLEAIVDWLRERGVGRARLDVHADNVRAQRAYAKAGFRPTGAAFASAIGPEIEMGRAVGG